MDTWQHRNKSIDQVRIKIISSWYHALMLLRYKLYMSACLLIDRWLIYWSGWCIGWWSQTDGLSRDPGCLCTCCHVFTGFPHVVSGESSIKTRTSDGYWFQTWCHFWNSSSLRGSCCSVCGFDVRRVWGGSLWRIRWIFFYCQGSSCLTWCVLMLFEVWKKLQVCCTCNTCEDICLVLEVDSSGVLKL